jgi:hypothetical protein
MKLSRNYTLIGMGVVGAGIVVWVVVMLVLESGGKKTAAVADANHCPVCGKELPPAYQGTGECPYCAANKAAGKATVQTSKGVSRNLVVPGILGGLFAILLGTHVALLIRNRKIAAAPEELYYFQCPKCKRKMRFREKQAGRLGACPLCRRPIVFPRLDKPENGWIKMKRWLGIAHG